MPTCPTCSADIASGDINVGEGVAVCPSCGELHRLSELAGANPDATTSAHEPLPTEPPEPVPGTSYHDDGMIVTIVASARNMVAAVFLVLFSAFWNGLSWTFCLAAWTRIIMAFGVTPFWAPANPGSGPIASAMTMSLVLAIVMAVFVVPFILIGLAMIWATLYSMFGRLEFVVTEMEGWVREPIGPFGKRKRFDPRMVTSIGTKVEMRRDSSGDVHVKRNIVIERSDGKPIKVGSSIKDKRRKFAERALRYAVLSRRQSR